MHLDMYVIKIRMYVHRYACIYSGMHIISWMCMYLDM